MLLGCHHSTHGILLSINYIVQDQLTVPTGMKSSLSLKSVHMERGLN